MVAPSAVNLSDVLSNVKPILTRFDEKNIGLVKEQMEQLSVLLRDEEHRLNPEFRDLLPSLLQYFIYCNCDNQGSLSNSSETTVGHKKREDLIGLVLKVLTNAVVDDQENRDLVMKSDKTDELLSIMLGLLEGSFGGNNLIILLHFIRNLIIDNKDAIDIIKAYQCKSIEYDGNSNFITELMKNMDSDSWDLIVEILEEIIDSETPPEFVLSTAVLDYINSFSQRLGNIDVDLEDLEKDANFLFLISKCEFDANSNIIASSMNLFANDRLEEDGTGTIKSLLHSATLNISYNRNIAINSIDPFTYQLLKVDNLDIKSLSMVILGNFVTSERNKTDLITSLNIQDIGWLSAVVDDLVKISKMYGSLKYSNLQGSYLLNKLITDHVVLKTFMDNKLINKYIIMLENNIKDTSFQTVYKAILSLNISFLTKLIISHSNNKISIEDSEILKIVEFVKKVKLVEFNDDEVRTCVDKVMYSLISTIIVMNNAKVTEVKGVSYHGKSLLDIIELTFGLSHGTTVDFNKPLEFDYIFEKFKTIGLILSVNELSVINENWFEPTFNHLESIYLNMKPQMNRDGESTPQEQSNQRMIKMLFNNFKFICGKIIERDSNDGLTLKSKTLIEDL